MSAGLVAPSSIPTFTQATWTDSAVLNQALCPVLEVHHQLRLPDGIAGENFASIAEDKAGYLYVTFTWAPCNNSGATPGQAAPGGNLRRPLAAAGDHGRPVDGHLVRSAWKISDNQATPGTNIFPWITAGNGRTRGRRLVPHQRQQ